MDYIYTRVSDKKQEEGTSPDTQLADCRKLCGKNFVHVHDTQKGGIPLKRRKALMDLISMLKRGDRLICPRSDRLSRSGETIGLIKYLVYERGATIEYADGTKIATGENTAEWIQSKMLEVLAEYEKLIISCRIRKAYVQKREKGEAMGVAPYGYRNVKKMVVEHPEEQKTLSRMIELREQGTAFREIAKILTAEGHRTRKGSEWPFQNIQRILKRVRQSECLSPQDLSSPSSVDRAM